MNALEKLFRCYDVSLTTWIRTEQTMVFPVTFYDSKIGQKQDRMSIDNSEF